MIISCLYPKKIFIDDEITKEQVQNVFGENFDIYIGDWFDCPTREDKNINNFNNENKMQNINQINSRFSKNNEKNNNYYEFYSKNNAKTYNFDFWTTQDQKENTFNDYSSNSNKKNVYVVKPMDTYQSVSKKLGISIDELKSIAKTKHLFVGQKIDIQKG